MEEKINAVLEKLRPFLINDGGDIELVKFEDGIAYIKFMGACADCGLQNITLNHQILNLFFHAHNALDILHYIQSI